VKSARGQTNGQTPDAAGDDPIVIEDLTLPAELADGVVAGHELGKQLSQEPEKAPIVIQP
jgi:hypothetical protein